MSHDRGRRAACRNTIQVLWLHFESLSIARGVTAMVVGSGDLLGLFSLLLTLVKNVKVTLLKKKCIVGIPADELFDLESGDERYPSLFHLAAHEVDFGAENLRFLLAHKSAG